MADHKPMMAAGLLQMTASPQLKNTLDKVAIYGATSTTGFQADMSKAWLGTQALQSVASSGLFKARKPKMADVLRAQAIAQVTEYVQKHPQASEKDIQQVLAKAIQEFVTKLSQAKANK
eukprot:m.193732 g.193732  ORF g.193732 m.193732 type:complete len:119 (+) comp16986_c0_seq1:76-432(+)